jgi:iron complex outermembrane receptor protein
MTIRKGALFATLIVLPAIGMAQEQELTNSDEADEIVVVGRSVATSSARVAVDREILVDTAAVLKEIPGANVNRNGMITGIAQYRGMYGDRVAIDIDKLGVISGGPNAMDSPLSYMSPMMTEELVVARGIASVSLAPESIGGHISTTMSRGEFGGDNPEASGVMGTRFSDNGNVRTTAARLTLANQRHRVSVIAEVDSGYDINTPEGEIRPSGLHRDRYDLSYAITDGDRHMLFFAGALDTEDTGTPALPMDIILIDTSMFGVQFGFDVSPQLSIEGRVSYNDVDHLMDNHSMRAAPDPAKQRLNTTSGKGSQFSFAGVFERADSTLRIGVDGIAAEHASVITNPNNVTFRVNNFTGVERDLLGAFAEWVRDGVRNGFEAGLRYNRVETNAGEVGSAGMMGMMGMNAGSLADAFNASRRRLSWNTVDAVFKYRRLINATSEWSIELGTKSRAPSYQELYLWLPLQATGGLADGRTYIGNLKLKKERSQELVIGYSTENGRFGFSPQLFYKSIDDYIQGVSSNNMVANMVSTMMSGAPPLQFENVDARIWGLDAAWRYQLTEKLLVDGVITVAQGRRTDVTDNLYRLSPYNGSIGLTYSTGSWSLKSEVTGYLDQNKVSSYNGEQESAGYWLASVAFAWSPVPALRLEARLDNLFDESYQDHLAGINRPAGSDIRQGVHLFGAERTISAGVMYSF